MLRPLVVLCLGLAFPLACGGGHAGVDGGGGKPDVMLKPATGTPGVWENVTSPEMPASLLRVDEK